MNDFTDEDILNDVLNVLKKDPDNSLIAIVPEITSEVKKEVDIVPVFNIEGEYKKLLNKLEDSLKNNSSILDEAALLVKTVGDEKTLEAYASVAKSNAELLKTLANALAEREHLRVQEILKREEIAARKEIAAAKNDTPKLPTGTTNIQNNYILKSSRDDMFNALFGSPEEKEKALNKILTNSNEENQVIEV